MPSTVNTTTPARIAISEKDRATMKRGFYAFIFLIVFGPISWLLTTYWDRIPAPPRSREIKLDATPSNDLDRISAVLLRADIRLVSSKENLQISHMTFYSSSADPAEVRSFYLQAPSTPWHVAADQESKGRRVILYREMFEADSKIIVIEKRLTRDADNHVTDGPGSLIGTADLKPN